MPILSDFSYGLAFLDKMPTERLFQLFVDGTMHHKEQGQKGFEKREPNCMKGFYGGLKIALANIDKPLSLDLILRIHAASSENVTGHFYVNSKYAGKFREWSLTTFAIPKERCTINGVARLYQKYKKKGKSAEKSPELFTSLNRKKINLLSDSYSLEYIQNIAKLVYERIDNENFPFAYSPPYSSCIKLKSEAEAIIKLFHEEINVADDSDKKILSIVKCAQELELLHPFGDGNGRVFINIMLNFLLMQNGFPPATFYEPNLFDLYSESELVDAVKDAMNNTLFSIQHPERALFSYDISTLSRTEKEEHELLTQPLRDLLSEKKQALTHEAYSLQLGAINTYLQSAWQGEINVFRACALGDLAYLNQYLPSVIDLKNLAPEHTTPLYKGYALLHIACRMNQQAVAEQLLKMDSSIVNQLDSQYNTPLHYAVATGNIELVDLLLENGADIFSYTNENKNQSPLDEAAMHGTLLMFQKLITLHPKNKIDYMKLFINTIKGKNLNISTYLVDSNNISSDQIKDMINMPNESNPFVISLRNHDKEMFIYLWDLFTLENKAFFSHVKKLLPLIAQENNIDILNAVLLKTDLETKHTRIDYDLFFIAFTCDVRETELLLLRLFEIEKDLANITDRTGNSILHLISAFNRPKLLQVLLDKGLDINKPSSDGFTPLHNAACSNSLEMIDALCRTPGIDINFQMIQKPSPRFPYSQEERKRESPLHIAVQYGHFEAAKKLVYYGAIVTDAIIVAVPNSKDKERFLQLLDSAYIRQIRARNL